MQGHYRQLDYEEAWAKLWSVVKAQKLFTDGIELIGITYDDPTVTEAKKIRYDTCLVSHKKKGQTAGRNRGQDTKRGKVRHDVREKYRNNPQRTEASKLKTEIYIPIKYWQGFQCDP